MKPTRLIALLLIPLLSGCVGHPPSPPAKILGIPTIDAKDDKSGVVLKLFENQDLPIGQGFSVFIEGWMPNDHVSLEAISPSEQVIPLLNDGATLPVSAEGEVGFSIPYKHKNLYPGRWLLVVNGKSGAHAHYFNVPLK